MLTIFLLLRTEMLTIFLLLMTEMLTIFLLLRYRDADNLVTRDIDADNLFVT